MRWNISIAILVCCTFISCDSESENPDSDGIDLTPPSVNIVGLGDTLEELTSIMVAISDDSQQVDTSVLINNNEIVNTKEKQFSFEIDPFSFPVGETILTIKSTDENGNESETNKTFELEKLLIAIAEDQPMNNVESQEVFYSVNTMEGELLGYSEVLSRRETVKIYAPDNYDKQPLILTAYLLSSSVGPAMAATSYSNIEPGTNFLLFQESVGLRTENNAAEIDSGLGINAFFDYTITGIPFEPSETEFVGFGSSYGLNGLPTVSSNGSDFDFLIKLGHNTNENTKEVVITNGLFQSLDELVDFTYFSVEDLNNQSISYTERKVPDDFITIQIPETVTRGSTIRLDGIYQDANARFDSFGFLLSTPFDLNASSEYTVSNITMPIINRFDNLRFTTDLNLVDGNKELVSSTIGVQDINLPTWDATLVSDKVVTSGNFDLISIEIKSDANNFVLEESFRWTYFSPKENEIAIPFEMIEIPDVVTQNPKFPIIPQKSFISNGILSVILESFSEQPSYEQSLFRNIFEQGRKGNELSLRIPLQN